MTADEWTEALLADDVDFAVTLCGHTRCHGQWWRIPERTLAEEHLVCVIHSGAMMTEIAGEIDGRFDDSQAIWLPPGVPHRFWLPSIDDAMLVTHIRFTTATTIPDLPCVAPRTPVVDALALRMWDDEGAPGPFLPARRRAGMVLLLSELMRARAAAAGGPRLTPLQVRSVRALVEQADPAIRWEPADLARAADLAPGYFTRRFTPTFGCSPRTWLKRQRIERAAQVLAESTASIGAIAELFGYDELFRFSRQFQEVMGCSPSAWRRRHQPPKGPGAVARGHR